jgi:hypothetical protein
LFQDKRGDAVSQADRAISANRMPIDGGQRERSRSARNQPRREKQVVMAYVTEDGSIIDRVGKVIFFSAQRFVDDICLGNCCFICGAKPEHKPFNNEHILPEWLLRRYDLFSRTITLPNDRTVRYDRYTVPCCVDCNSRWVRS